LVHLVSFENELAQAGGMVKAYKEIRAELEKYGQGLDTKEEIILFTKTDMLPDDEREAIIAKMTKAFHPFGRRVYTSSLYDDASVKAFADDLIRFIKSSEPAKTE
jgi:GTPase involved in cell partitioning and DNA repair